jgi:hypothetical protein
MKLHTRDVQRLLTAAGYYNAGIDGDYGPKSKTAVGKVLDNNASKVPGRMSERRRMIAAAQLILDAAGYEPGEIDGYDGHNTVEAFNAWDYRQTHGKEEALDRDDGFFASPDPAPANASVWPRQGGVSAFYGAVGTNQVRIDLPYRMRIAWNLRQSVASFLCHERVAEPMRLIFVRVADHYGVDRLKPLGLDLFGGCLNVRKMRGGSSYSMHSWGIAVDLDPANNQLRWNHTRARFAQPEYAPFWRIVEDAGAVSLGRARDFDWMHFQFARL